MFVVAGLIFISLALASAFLAAFIWAVKSGQFEDVYTPSLRLLTEEKPPKPVTQPQTKHTET
jgi:cbb3-type cytochrome oxidase maturation protein